MISKKSIMHIYFNIIHLKTNEIYNHIKYLSKVQSNYFNIIYIFGFSTSIDKIRLIKKGNIEIYLLPKNNSFIKNYLMMVAICIKYFNKLRPSYLEIHHYPLSFLYIYFYIIDKKCIYIQKFYGNKLIQGYENNNLFIKMYSIFPFFIFYLLNKYKIVNKYVMVNDGTKGYILKQIIKIKKDNFLFLDQTVYRDVLSSKNKCNLKYIILYVGNMNGWKRQDRFINVANMFLKNYNIKNVIFTIVGEGKYYYLYKNMVIKYEISKYVKFLGYLNRPALSYLLKNTDIYLSLYDYSCVGMSTLESMLCEIPTIVGNSGDTKKLLHGGAIITPLDDYNLIAKIIYNLLMNKRKRILWGKKSKKHIISNFNTPLDYWEKETNFILSKK